METPKEKANELINKYKNYLMDSDSHAALGIELDLAIIAVDEIIKEIEEIISISNYWRDVKEELNKL